MGNELPAQPGGSTRGRLALFVLLMLFLLGCNTLPPFPAADLDQPGWRVWQGQGVWKPKGNAVELAGEFLVAAGPEGALYSQFTKDPFPLIIARTTKEGWEFRIPAKDKRYSRHGQPPGKIGWLVLPKALAGGPAPPPWFFSREGISWELRNQKTGESISGYIDPADTGKTGPTAPQR